MNKPLLSLLMMIFLSLAALPGVTRAASGGDYTPLAVPDLSQAVDFFHDVMNCAVISVGAATDAKRVALMDCGDGAIVELSSGPATRSASATNSGKDAGGIAFVIENPAPAATWLRAHRIVVVGQPVTIATGPHAGKLAVTFITPWGQPLQLVSQAPAAGSPGEPAAGTRLAAQ